mmetsp:Transcript_23096/g.37100  ORF Transcript_23096/g.37100 Transcript_23096/m.37100 type:complete len:110 (+) Transcript_23096:1127-1456(+)
MCRKAFQNIRLVTSDPIIATKDKRVSQTITESKENHSLLVKKRKQIICLLPRMILNGTAEICSVHIDASYRAFASNTLKYSTSPAAKICDQDNMKLLTKNFVHVLNATD